MSEDTGAFDALLPPEMAAKAEALGAAKAQQAGLRTFALAVLGGAFIALGAAFSTTVVAGANGTLPLGVTRLLAGASFSLGLILVSVGGAELFTGNMLTAMAWASGRVRTRALLTGWALAFAGNALGAIATAALVFASGQYAFWGGDVGTAALASAQHRLSFGFAQALVLGVLGNALVCLAVWLALSARSAWDRIACVVPPVTAFVAAGFEHSIANLFFVPIALLIRDFAPPEFWVSAQLDPSDFVSLSATRFVAANLVPVVLGNMLGGAVLVGGVYWLVYLRARPR
jgi:formate/nitrite transporter